MRGAPLALALLLVLGPGCADDATSPGPASAAIAPSVVLEVGGVPVRARVAQRHAARRAGLKGVRTLAPDEGMLFVYREPARRRFWMHGCRIALDIAFLDGAGRVLQVETLDPPTSGGAPARTRLSPPAAYALEVGAGFFARHGLGVGTRVRIPAAVARQDADP